MTFFTEIIVATMASSNYYELLALLLTQHKACLTALSPLFKS